MSPTDVCDRVAEVIRQRGDLHGDWRRNMLQTAAMWSRYKTVRFEPADVAIFNCLQKISRASSGGLANFDDYIDLVGYAAIATALISEEFDEEE